MTTAYNPIIEEILRQQREAQGSPYQNLKSTVGKIGKTGKNMTTVGDYMKNNLSNPTLQRFGSNISSVGSKLSNGANTVNNVITPQNYFKGFAPKPFAALGQNAASGAVGNTAGSTIGNAIGSEVAGTTAGGSALTSAISEAAPMATASGLGAGMATGAGASAAGGAAVGAGTGAAAGTAGAAGGSAAGAGAAAGPIGALVALGVMAATGANRKRAKKSGQALLSGLNKEGESALNQTNEFAKNMQNQTQDYSQSILPTNNEITGGASPVDNINTQVFQDYMNNNPVTNAIQQLDSNNINTQESTQPLAAEISQEETKRGLLDKFLSGVSDLSRGYQENRLESFNPNNLTADKFTETITNPANTQKIVDYQNQLTNDAAYNDWATRAGVDKAAAIKAIEEGKNSGNADVDNWIKNNQDAYKETQETKTYNKGKMARLGEALGTMGRVAQNPLVQGLVAGGLSAALTGNPLYGLGQGYKFANNRAMSDIYSNALKQYGFDVPNVGMFGNLDNKDFNALMMPQYKQAMTDLAQAKLLEQQNYHNQMIENQKNLNEVRQQNADTNAYKAKNGSKVTHVSTGGGKKTGGSSSQYQLVNGKDGNVYKLNKATGEYVIVGKEGAGSKGNQTIPETEEEFRNRVFKNKKGSSSDKGWAF